MEPVRPFSAGCALLLSASLWSLTPSIACSQDEGSEPAIAEVPADGEADEIPPIPDWTPESPEVRTEFEAARKSLDERSYPEAEKAFKRLRSKAKGTDGEPVIARCLLEAEGGILCEKAGEFAAKGQHRRVIALWIKEGEKLDETFTGAELEKFFDEAFAEVFMTLADFEKKSAATGAAEGGEDGGGDGGNGGRGGATGGRGSTAYGQNTRLITGTPEEGEVRNGSGALYWMTTATLGSIQIGIPEEVRLANYRYLRISVRTEDPKSKPSLLLLFDCEAGELQGGGGGQGGRGGRRGGNWGAAQVHRRVGFHMEFSPEHRYQDLRLDLKKFEEKGNAKWPNVLSLKLVHFGGAETGIFIDDVILEKE